MTAFGTARVLIVAGSDSGGGAGIQADIKTVTMLGGHAMTAITAITAQNTIGVQAVHAVPADMVLAQVDSCLSDIGADAIKIGMIGSAATAHALADRLAGVDVPIVFDPVMVATSGGALADADTIAAFGRLMDVATVVTPNVPELAALTGEDVTWEEDGERAAQWLADRHRIAVLAKGGHRMPQHTAQLLGEPDGKSLVDHLARPDEHIVLWSDPRIDTQHTHGTGCTLASALATGLAQGMSLEAAIQRARMFVRAALEAAPGLGKGHGPLGQQHVNGFSDA